MIAALGRVAPPFIKRQWRDLRRRRTEALARERGQMSAVRTIPFGVNPPAPRILRPNAGNGSAARVTAGDPVTTVHNYFTDYSGRFFCGIWESTPGKWDLDYTESEFIYLISGKVRVTDAAGHEETFGPGSAFVIPPGFKGSWEALEPLRKYYVTFS